MEVEKLSWSNTIDEQEKAVSELANSRDIDLKELIMPFGKKEIIEVALEMFEWLQDLNWPGAMDIVSRLKKLPTDVLRRLYQVSLDKAKNDAEWLFF